jgi:hypothetical protein
VIFCHGGHPQAGTGPVEEPRQADGGDNGDDPANQQVHRDQHIAEEQRLQRKDDREGPNGGAEQQQHQPAQQDQQANCDHDHRKDRFPDELRKENPLDHIADKTRQNQ